jgi:hypothetical protein
MNLETPIRGACKQYYADRSLAVGRSLTRKKIQKTTTYCPNCPDQPLLCIEYFKILHYNLIFIADLYVDKFK